MRIEPSVPSEFDAFWRETIAEAEAAPFDYDVSPEATTPVPGTGQTAPGVLTGDHEIRTFSFRSITGDTLHGWRAIPNEPLGDGGVPGFLWIAPYGRESLMPNQYGTRIGWASLSFNFFGHDSFHQERYNRERGYFAEGILDARTWVFRRMFQDAAIALKVLADQPGIEPSRLAAAGMSQGGGMSIWLGAWSDRVKAVCADMPFLGAMRETLMKNVYRYPLKEIRDYLDTGAGSADEVFATLSYFDTLNQATRCAKPTLVSVGLKDPAVKPVQVRSIFAALPGEKRLVEYDWGHDWHPDMVANNLEWLRTHV